jgi:hypothetical protein
MTTQLGAYSEGYRAGQEDLLRYYSAALDEIFRLRKALALEARVIEAHLSYRTFPKSRRSTAEQQVEMMRGAARGEAATLYAGVPCWLVDSSLKEAEATASLTRDQWEREVDES